MIKFVDDLNSMNLERMINNSESKIQRIKHQLENLDIEKKELELKLEKEELRLRDLKSKKEK